MFPQRKIIYLPSKKAAKLSSSSAKYTIVISSPVGNIGSSLLSTVAGRLVSLRTFCRRKNCFSTGHPAPLGAFWSLLEMFKPFCKPRRKQSYLKPFCDRISTSASWLIWQVMQKQSFFSEGWIFSHVEWSQRDFHFPSKNPRWEKFFRSIVRRLLDFARTDLLFSPLKTRRLCKNVTDVEFE